MKKKEKEEKLQKEQEIKNDNILNEEMLKLETEINNLTEENKNLVNKLQLAQADLINYRKRKDEEVTNMLKYANQNLITEVLPIVDNFERALKEEDKDISDELKKFLTGFKMMYVNLTEVLKKYGVEEINRVGQIFDPKQEQALLTDSIADKQDEEVLEVLLKGYKLKDRVIRPASVKVNQK